MGDSFNPPNNSTVTERIGAVNITFECEIFLDSGQVATAWSVGNFEGIAGSQALGNPTSVLLNETLVTGESTNDTAGTFRNELIFIEFIESLDGVTLFCGSGANLEVGRFFLHVYRKCISNLLEGGEGIIFFFLPYRRACT